MGIELRRFPEHDLALRIVSGPTSVEDVIRFYKGLDASHAPRWITYIDPDTTAAAGDVVPVARVPELRQVIAAKMEELFGDRPVVSIVVCPSRQLRGILKFWRAYSPAGEAHPIRPALFRNLDEAFERLGLPEAARAAVTSAIEERTEGKGERNARRGSSAPMGPP